MHAEHKKKTLQSVLTNLLDHDQIEVVRMTQQLQIGDLGLVLFGYRAMVCDSHLPPAQVVAHLKILTLCIPWSR